MAASITETGRSYNPNMFQRSEQATAARKANVDSFQQAERQRIMADLFSHGIFPVDAPADSGDISLPSSKQVLLTAAAAIAVLNVACGTDRTPTGAPGVNLPNRPVATEPAGPSLPNAIANANATNVAEGKPPVQFNTPIPPAIATANAEAAKIATARAGTPTATTEKPGIGGAEPIPTFPPGHPRENENPGIDAANKKDAEARATATAEAKQPEVILTQEQRVAKIKALIAEIQNPDQDLIKKYSIVDTVLGGAQERIIKGSKGLPPRVQPVKGLIDMQRTLEANEYAEARAIGLEVITRSILERSLSGDKENIDSDLVKLTPEQLKDIDPEGVIPQLRAKAPNDGRVSVVWLKSLADLIAIIPPIGKSG